MSYCRFSEGDVYMLEQSDGSICCCACKLTQKTSHPIPPDGALLDMLHMQAKLLGRPNIDNGVYDTLHFETLEQALAHLLEHIKAGDKIPRHVIERLKAEIVSIKFCHLIVRLVLPAIIFKHARNIQTPMQKLEAKLRALDVAIDNYEYETRREKS